jgi:hypothetical protein
MTLPDGTTIAATDINIETRGYYYYEMSIWHARNGYYFGINDASSRRPFGAYVGGKTNDGYAYSDWWGYCHGCSYVNVYQALYEGSADADTCVRRWNFQYDYIADAWAWYNQWSYAHQARAGDQLYAYYDGNVGWGWGGVRSLHGVYSTYRGWLHLYYESTFTYREVFWTASSGETIYVYNYTDQ